MHISRAQFKRLQPLLPKPRGSRRISHYRFLNALAFMASNGCKWRSLPSRFGPLGTRCTCAFTAGPSLGCSMKYSAIYNKSV